MRFSTCVFVCFFFKQKTAYEMRISDWSSDVCSSDLGAQPSLLNRLINAWRDIAGSPGSVVRSDLSSDGDRRWLVEQMQSCLESRGGDVSARARAAALGRTYLSLDAEGREKFLTLLAEAR